MEYSQLEIFNSYLFLRNILGCINKKKDDSFLMGIRYTGDKILALNENSTKSILILVQNKTTKLWYIDCIYIELVPIAWHILKSVQYSKNPYLSEPAFEALKEIIKYDI